MALKLQAVNQEITGAIDQKVFEVTLSAYGGDISSSDEYTYEITESPNMGILEEFIEIPELRYTARDDFYARDEFLFGVEDDDETVSIGKIRIIVLIEPTLQMIDDLRLTINDVTEPYAFSEEVLFSIYRMAMTEAYGPRSTAILAAYKCYQRLLVDSSLRADWRQYEIQQDDSDLYDHIKDLLGYTWVEYEKAVEDEILDSAGQIFAGYKELVLPPYPRYVGPF